MAADSPTSVGRDTEFITIQRPIRDIAVDAGQQHVETIVLQNQTARAVQVTTVPKDLATRNSGSRSLDVQPAGSQRRGAGRWLTVLDKDIQIPSFSQKTIRVRADVPANATSGAWAGAALLDVSGVGQTSTVELHQETSVAFLMTVHGSARRDLEVSLRPDHRWLLRGGASQWRVVVTNRGDAFESFGGHVTIDAGIGGSRDYPLQSGILFPGERRVARITADLRPTPDVVHGRVDVTSRGRSGSDTSLVDIKRSASTSAVVVLPWWLPVLLLIALVVIVLRVRRRTGADDEPFEQYEP